MVQFHCHHHRPGLPLPLPANSQRHFLLRRLQFLVSLPSPLLLLWPSLSRLDLWPLFLPSGLCQNWMWCFQFIRLLKQSCQLGCFQFGILGVFKKSEERKMIHIKKTFLDSNGGRGLKQSRRHLWSFGHSPANRNAIPDWWWLTLCGIVHSSFKVLSECWRESSRVSISIPLKTWSFNLGIWDHSLWSLWQKSAVSVLRCFELTTQRRSCQLLCGLVPNWQSKPDQKQPTQRRSEEHPSTSSLLVRNAFRRQFGGRTSCFVCKRLDP